MLRALVSGVNDTARALPDVARTTVTQQALANQGWAIPNPIIGDYGTDYTYRAGVAVIGLGANTPVESVYPTAFGDADGRPFDGASRYRLTFPPGQPPPARAFWSLTMYDEDGYLVANPQNRYAVGDSHPPLRRRPDGSIVIVLQRTAPTEEDVNWLPTPPGGSASTCACTCRSAACSTGAGARRPSSASAESLGRPGPGVGSGPAVAGVAGGPPRGHQAAGEVLLEAPRDRRGDRRLAPGGGARARTSASR